MAATLICIATGLSNAEILSQWFQLRDEGLYSWRVLRLRSFLADAPLFLKKISDVVLGYPGILFVLATRQIAAVAALIFLFDSHLSAAFLWIIVLTSLLVSMRHPFGQEGSDQMIIVVSTAVAIAATFPNSLDIARLSVAFIALQALVSYFFSGLSKLLGKQWRNGTAVGEILQMDLFGSPALGMLISKRKWLNLVAGWAVMMFEILFPLVIILPTKVVVFYVIMAVMFHATNAVLMGLNCFVWAYMAAMPCIIHLSLLIDRSLWGS